MKLNEYRDILEQTTIAIETVIKLAKSKCDPFITNFLPSKNSLIAVSFGKLQTVYANNRAQKHYFSHLISAILLSLYYHFMYHFMGYIWRLPVVSSLRRILILIFHPINQLIELLKSVLDGFNFYVDRLCQIARAKQQALDVKLSNFKQRPLRWYDIARIKLLWMSYTLNAVNNRILLMLLIIVKVISNIEVQRRLYLLSSGQLMGIEIWTGFLHHGNFLVILFSIMFLTLFEGLTLTPVVSFLLPEGLTGMWTYLPWMVILGDVHATRNLHFAIYLLNVGMPEVPSFTEFYRSGWGRIWLVGGVVYEMGRLEKLEPPMSDGSGPGQISQDPKTGFHARQAPRPGQISQDPKTGFHARQAPRPDF